MQQRVISGIGWNDAWAAAFTALGDPTLSPARVTAEHRGAYQILGDGFDGTAEVSGRMRHDAFGRGGFPAVGDWVATRIDSAGGRAVIHAVLPRTGKFSRRAAGTREEEQVVAANVDVVFVVAALDRQFNPRRIERFLAAAWDSGARPVVVLTKADLVEDPDAYADQVAAISFGVPIHATSVETGAGMDALAGHLAPGVTVALLGSSGAGKSSLVNRLRGDDAMAVGAVSLGLDRGRHTTTHRQLLVLPGGALVIDTPGMRELQFWDGEDGADAVFEDVLDLAAGCRFRDCRHEAEPGCAVRRAIAEERLSSDRLESYRKLKREQAYAARQHDPKAMRDHGRAFNALARQAMRDNPKTRR